MRKPRKKPMGKSKHERKDGIWISDVDSMHTFMPYLLPDRIANEAVAEFEIDLTAANEFLEKKNTEDVKFRYTLFHLVVAALAKTIALRPKLNRFYSGHRLYERKEISLSFVCKKALNDTGAESLLTVKVDRESETDPLEQAYSAIKKRVTGVREMSETDNATDSMEKLAKLPRWLLRILVKLVFWADYHGYIPSGLLDDVPYYSTVFISNLGSIKMSASYHHLANFGTNSIFACIGEKQWKPIFARDGSYEMKETVALSLTADERIADGVYYAKSFRFLKYFLEHPESLERPLMEEPDNV